MLVRPSHTKILAVLAVGIAFPFVVRRAIGFFHPKEGVLLQFVSLVGEQELLHWVGENLSLPIYDFLISLWQRHFVFFILWLSVVALAVCLVSARGRQRVGL